MRLLLISVTITIFFSFSFPENKKDKLLAIVDEFDKTSLVILQEYDNSTVNFLANGQTFEEYFLKLTVIIHEGYHSFSFKHNLTNANTREYRINDTLTFQIKKFDSFPSKELNRLVDLKTQNKIFRYKTYIDSKDSDLDTQKNGFLGILEEYNAYYQEFKSYNALNNFILRKYGYQHPDIWVNYLCDIGSVIYSLDEFNLFISWYLQTSKEYYPEIYLRIIEDVEIKKLYTFISLENEKLKSEYKKNKATIISSLPNEFKVSGQWLGNSFSSKSMHDEQVNLTKETLNKSEHKILELLLKN